MEFLQFLRLQCTEIRPVIRLPIPPLKHGCHNQFRLRQAVKLNRINSEHRHRRSSSKPADTPGQAQQFGQQQPQQGTWTGDQGLEQPQRGSHGNRPTIHLFRHSTRMSRDIWTAYLSFYYLGDGFRVRVFIIFFDTF